MYLPTKGPEARAHLKCISSEAKRGLINRQWQIEQKEAQVASSVGIRRTFWNRSSRSPRVDRDSKTKQNQNSPRTDWQRFKVRFLVFANLWRRTRKPDTGRGSYLGQNWAPIHHTAAAPGDASTHDDTALQSVIEHQWVTTAWTPLPAPTGPLARLRHRGPIRGRLKNPRRDPGRRCARTARPTTRRAW